MICDVRRRPIINGAFAVEKSADEDSAIFAHCPTNTLVDKSKLFPMFARVVALRGVTLREGKRLRVYKRDGHHFFFHLAV